MVRLKCPRCATLFTPDGTAGAPMCPGCGFSAPSTAPTYASGLAAPPGMAAPSPGAFQAVAPQGRNGTAVASMVLGIVGIPFFMLVIPGLLAFIFGIIGLRQTRDHSGGGRGMAIAGLSLGSVSLGIMLILFTIFIIEVVLYGW